MIPFLAIPHRPISEFRCLVAFMLVVRKLIYTHRGFEPSQSSPIYLVKPFLCCFIIPRKAFLVTLDLVKAFVKKSWYIEIRTHISCLDILGPSTIPPFHDVGEDWLFLCTPSP